MSGMELCDQANGKSGYGEGFASVLLDQCTPYINFLLKHVLYFIITSVLAFLLFLLFLLLRYVYNLCGGRRPSVGGCCVTRHAKFQGYSRGGMLRFKVFVSILVLLAFVGVVASQVGNVNISTTMAKMSGTVATVADNADRAVRFATPLLSIVSNYVSSGVVQTIHENVVLAQEYFVRVEQALEIVDHVNGNRGYFGRTQLTTICLFVPLGVMCLGLLLAWLGVVGRGSLHVLIALVLAIASFGIITVSMVHALTYYTLTDTCRYLGNAKSRADSEVLAFCGRAREHTIEYGLNVAVTQSIHSLCNGPYARLCNTYFDCDGNDWAATCSKSHPTFADAGRLFHGARLLVNSTKNGTHAKVVSNITLPLCLVVDGCFGYPAAAAAANGTIESTGIVASAIDQLNTSVAPYIRCTLGESTVRSLVHRTCDLSEEAKIVAWWAAGLYAVTCVVVVLFVLGGKRFNDRNEYHCVQERLALRASLADGLGVSLTEEQRKLLAINDDETDESDSLSRASDSQLSSMRVMPDTNDSILGAGYSRRSSVC